MKIEPVGFLSTHNVEGPFKLQFHKTREEIYTDTCLRIDTIYTEAQLRQLGEACAAVCERTPKMQAYGNNRAVQDECASEIRALIKELLS